MKLHRTGLPVNRSLAIEYTHNNEVYDPRFQNEFLFGPSMLVAPVASTDKAVQVYLPEGTWYRFGVDEKFEGDRVIWAASPLDNLPVFIKAGAIIPMQNVIQSTADKGNGTMYLNIWFSELPDSYTYYEDDGTTYQYKSGNYHERVINLNPSEHEIIMNHAEGNYSTRFKTIELVLHGFPEELQLTVNGKPKKAHKDGSIKTVSFQNENGKITVKW